MCLIIPSKYFFFCSFPVPFFQLFRACHHTALPANFPTGSFCRRNILHPFPFFAFRFPFFLCSPPLPAVLSFLYLHPLAHPTQRKEPPARPCTPLILNYGFAFFSDILRFVFFIRSQSLSARAGLQNFIRVFPSRTILQIKSSSQISNICSSFLFRFVASTIPVPYPVSVETFWTLYLHLRTHFS